MQNLAKFSHFEKFILLQQLLTKNKGYIGATICIFKNKLERFHSKSPLYEKNE